MSINTPQPHDVVLGGRPVSPTEGAVLGGFEGVKQRLSHPVPAQRIAALAGLQRYGTAGFAAIAQALNDPVIEVQRAAYRLLQAHSVPDALDAYCPYPLFDRCGTLRGHAQGIMAVALSPDEQTIVSSSRDRTVQVWDLPAQEAYLSFKAPFLVSAVSISADGRSVVLRDLDQQVRVWSLRNGQELPPDAVAEWDIGSLTPSPNLTEGDAMNQLSQGWLDDQNQGTPIDQGTPTEVQSHPVTAGDHRPKLRSIASIATQGDRYLISSSQATIRIWDLHQGREVVVLTGHTSLVTAIAAAPSGQWITSGSEDRTVGIWGIP